MNRGLVGGLDWARTPAFRMASGGEGMIRLNIKGREAKGFFEAESVELAQYVSWLQQCLMAIRVAGTDEPLIQSVTGVKDLFPGSKNHFLPDLLLKWAPAAPVEHIHSNEIGDIRARLSTGRGGNHVGKSFVVVSGPGAKTEAVREIAHIMDIGKFASSHFGLPARSESEFHTG